MASGPIQFSSVTQSCPTLRPHESQHARPPCPSPTFGVTTSVFHKLVLQPFIMIRSISQNKNDILKLVAMTESCNFIDFTTGLNIHFIFL